MVHYKLKNHDILYVLWGYNKQLIALMLVNGSWVRPCSLQPIVLGCLGLAQGPFTHARLITVRHCMIEVGTNQQNIKGSEKKMYFKPNHEVESVLWVSVIDKLLLLAIC